MCTSSAIISNSDIGIDASYCIICAKCYFRVVTVTFHGCKLLKMCAFGKDQLAKIN